MRNALNKLADTVEDPAEKKVSNMPEAHPAVPHGISARLA